MVSVDIISYIQAHWLISIRCLTYLAYVYDVIAKIPTVELVPVVCEFPDEFPTDLPGLSPERDVDFVIEVELGTKPICIPLYRMAPVELKELNTQLQGLLDLGFIWLSMST